MLTSAASLVLPAAIGYGYGVRKGADIGERRFVDRLNSGQAIDSLDDKVIGKILNNAFMQGKFDGIEKESIRKNIGKILDKVDIKHGDTVVPSDETLSGRYLISQWQRGAIGTMTSVFAYDENGDLCIAMGPQRGSFASPQGYGELHVPKDDDSGLYEKGGSRYNKKTGEVVLADKTSEGMAKEVEEELGIVIGEEKLTKVDFQYSINERGIPAMVGHFYIMLDSTVDLKNNDTEFKGTEFDGDDMDNPRWVRLKDIECVRGQCRYQSLPISDGTIYNLQQSLKHLGEDKTFLS